MEEAATFLYYIKTLSGKMPRPAVQTMARHHKCEWLRKMAKDILKRRGLLQRKEGRTGVAEKDPRVVVV